MRSEIIRNHPIEIENTTLLVGVGDPIYLPSSSDLDKVQMNQCVIRINGAQGGRAGCQRQAGHKLSRALVSTPIIHFFRGAKLAWVVCPRFSA
jgi:hypothetical protein